MSTVVVATVKSNTSSPPAFQNTSGTEIGTLCRAWVNFNGTGVVAIRAQFNVSSITDNGVGDYTVNFTTALADANYSSQLSLQSGGTELALLTGIKKAGLYSTTQLQIMCCNAATGASVDASIYSVSIFR